MATRIVGRRGALRTTNGGGRALFIAWIATAATLAEDDSDVADVANVLRARLAPADSVRDFDLDPPPADLAVAGRLIALARVNAELARRMSRSDPGLPPGSGLADGDRPWRLGWLGRLLDVHDMLVDVVPSAGALMDQADLALTAAEREALAVERWDTHVGEMQRRGHAPLVVLAAIEGGLAQAEAAAETAGSRWRLFRMHELCADLHLALGEPAAAARSWRAAARYVDEDLAAVTNELADECERTGRLS